MDERDKELMSQQNNDFLARLGLESDPFPAEADPSFYYENPDLMQRLDMIQHLIGFSNQMIFVTGEEGVGKTSMLDRLEYYAPDHWRICHIQANPMLNTPVLLRQLINGFEIDVNSESDDLFQAYSDALQSHIETLERAMLTPVVLIDNAHELPVDAFTMLFGFMQQEGGHSRLKMALFCEPQITRMLESPQLKTLSHNLTHQLEIPGFDEKQTGEYLQQRLNHAGLTGDFPFSTDTIHKIYKESEGIASRIHTYAQQLLLNDEPQMAVDEEVDIEVLEEPESFPIVDEVLAFDDPEDETSTAAVKPKIVRETAVGRKFHSWQLGAVVAVLALLAGVLWLTSQFNGNPEPSIAAELPLDLSQDSVDRDPSLFEESNRDESIDLEDEIDLTTLDPNIDKGIAPVEDTEIDVSSIDEPTTSESLEQNDATEQSNEQLTSLEAGEEVIDPLDDLVQTMENEEHGHDHADGEAGHEHSTVTVVEDENGVTQIVEVPKEETPPISELIELTEVEPKTQEAVVEEVAKVVAKPEPVAVVEQVKPTKPTVKPTPPSRNTNNRPAISGVKGEAWLKIQKSSDVVLQILGTHDREALGKFLKSNEMGSDVAWFTTVHNEEPWYVIVKGPYRDRATATASVASLPENIRKRKPWPRTVASVKKAIDEAGR